MIACTVPRRGNQCPSRKIERVPRNTTGMTGTRACAATTNAPMRKGSKPGMRRNVPSGKNPSGRPLRIKASSCTDAVWTFQIDSGETDLQYWNGTTTTTVATAIANFGNIAADRIVFSEIVGGIQQVFAIDTNVSLTPVQLSSETVATKNLEPQTDGHHVVWYRSDGSGAELVLSGGLVFPASNLARVDLVEQPFQLDRGQMLFRNTGGALASPESVPVYAAWTIDALVGGDLDADGAPDLVGVMASGNQVQVLTSAGGGSFDPFVRYPAGAVPRDVELADVDRDGDLDVVVANSGPLMGGVSVLRKARGGCLVD